MSQSALFERLRKSWQIHRLRGKAEAAPLLAYLESPPAQHGLDWRKVRYLALDLETSGGDAALDDILSFGWVCIEDAEIRLSSARHRLVQPRRSLTEANVSIHRITDDRAAEGEALRDVLTDFLTDLQGRVLIAHYSPTEVSFIDAACLACFGGRFRPPVIDTLILARRAIDRPTPGSLRLASLRARHHLPRYPMHHALYDALAAAELFLAQAEAAGASDKGRLGDLLLS